MENGIDLSARLLPRSSAFAWLYLFGFGSRERIFPEISWEQCVISYPGLPRREWDLGTRLNNVYLNINYFLYGNSERAVLKRFQPQPRFHESMEDERLFDLTGAGHLEGINAPNSMK